MIQQDYYLYPENEMNKKIKSSDPSFYGTESIPKILLKVTPPVMLALLIQAMYNIVDSFFVGKFSEHGLTALSVIYPLQLIAIAFAVGTGVGVNTLMAKLYASGEREKANRIAGSGAAISVVLWALFAAVSALIMGPFTKISASEPEAVNFAYTYGMIVCVGSIGLFTESIFTKVHQAEGNMVLPMIAQVAGAVCNIILDPILIFGWGKIPALGVAGAAYATVAGQILAAVITGIRGFRIPPALKNILRNAKTIFHFAYPSILMQALFTVYIMALNFILASFCDEAVTVLGLYYKMQTFFFIPLFGLQTCIVPILSYNYALARYDRTRKTMRYSLIISGAFMIIGVLCFEFIPVPLLSIFSSSPKVFEIGKTAFRIIGSSFIPAAVSLMMPVFFQALGKAAPSVWLTLAKQIFCLIPLFYLFSLIGLDYSWIAFPAAETITGTIGLIMYFKEVRIWNSSASTEKAPLSQPTKEAE